MIDLYIIECQASDRTRYIRERDTDRMGRSNTIDDIYSGQVENVVSVFAFNISEGWCRDVTEDIARDCLDKACDEDFGRIPDCVLPLIERHMGFTEINEALAEYRQAAE